MYDRNQKLQRQRRLTDLKSFAPLILALVPILYPALTVLAFGIQSRSLSSTCVPTRTLLTTSTRLRNSLLITDLSDTSSDDNEPVPEKEQDAKVVTDANGVTIVTGAIVRVAVEGLKAYQINPKGQGAFDPETKVFRPDTTSEPKGRRGLIMPIGIRGEVTKIYTEGDLSANFPIQTKFEPGKHATEYDAPAAFFMHFSSQEVEVVG